MSLITVCTWLWSGGTTKHAPSYGPAHVHRLKRQLEEHCTFDFRFVCITDDPAGLECDTYPLWDEKKEMGGCYRRLKLFHKSSVDIGERLLSMDLDCQVIGDLKPLVRREEPAVFWKSFTSRTIINGSMWLCSPGSHNKLWDELPENARKITEGRRLSGSDQAWIAYTLGQQIPYWSNRDGVLALKRDCRKKIKRPPPHGRVVYTPGRPKPWDVEAQRFWPWLTGIEAA